MVHQFCNICIKLGSFFSGLIEWLIQRFLFVLWQSAGRHRVTDSKVSLRFVTKHRQARCCILQNSCLWLEGHSWSKNGNSCSYTFWAIVSYCHTNASCVIISQQLKTNCYLPPKAEGYSFVQVCPYVRPSICPSGAITKSPLNGISWNIYKIWITIMLWCTSSLVRLAMVVQES